MKMVKLNPYDEIEITSASKKIYSPSYPFNASNEMESSTLSIGSLVGALSYVNNANDEINNDKTIMILLLKIIKMN